MAVVLTADEQISRNLERFFLEFPPKIRDRSESAGQSLTAQHLQLPVFLSFLPTAGCQWESFSLVRRRITADCGERSKFDGKDRKPHFHADF